MDSVFKIKILVSSVSRAGGTALLKCWVTLPCLALEYYRKWEVLISFDLKSILQESFTIEGDFIWPFSNGLP